LQQPRNALSKIRLRISKGFTAKFREPSSTRSGKKGVALFMVIVSMLLIIIVISEIVMASQVDTKISKNGIHRLQAYYLASSAAKLSLLRLQIFKEISNQLKGSAAAQFFDSRLIDQVWSMSLPPLPLEGTDMKKNPWPGNFSATITSESSKIPINLIDGNRHRNSSTEIGKQVQDQVEALITGYIQTEDFEKTSFKGMETKTLVFPLMDWIDPNFDRMDGGDENHEYERMTPPYLARNDRLASISELHMIEGWNDDFVERFGPSFSILSYKTSVNPNYVSLNRIKSWGIDLSNEDLMAIEKRRRLQPFKDLADLEGFVKSDPDIRGGRTFAVTPPGLKSHTTEQSFLVEGVGRAGDITRTIRLGIYIPTELVPGAKTGKGDPDPKNSKLVEPQVIFVEELQ
jgi:hypothetical protein